MERKFCTVEELIKSGKMRKGDYIEYTPVLGSYTANPEETGCVSQKIETDENAYWILHSFNDEKKMFSIITKDGVNSLALRGSVGFSRGPETLHAICKECYSIPDKGIFARSMTIEDCDFSPNQNPERYAFYPEETKVSGVIKYEGNVYKKKSHFYRQARFYAYDGGGIEEIDENGIAYRRPLPNTPVFVTEANYRDNDWDEKTSKGYWLASQCIDVTCFNAEFYLPFSNKESSGVYGLFTSHCLPNYTNRAIRPRVSFSSQLLVDITDEHRNGSSPTRAWKLVIDETTIENSKFECNYKIIRVQDVDLNSACDKLEEEVNEYISHGFKTVGDFKKSSRNKKVILMQQVIRE